MEYSSRITPHQIVAKCVSTYFLSGYCLNLRTSIRPWNKRASCCYFCFVLFFDKLHVIFDTAKLLYNAPKRDRKGACSFIFTKKKELGMKCPTIDS